MPDDIAVRKVNNANARDSLENIGGIGEPGLLARRQVHLGIIPCHNKLGAKAKDSVSALEDAYASDCQMIMFPAGLVSRKQQGIIQDLEWLNSIVSKAIQHRRDIVPIFIDGRNSNFFYNLANFRKKIGLKANIEMLYLPDETFKQRNRTFTLYIGQPIEWESLDKSKKPIEWAQEIKRKVYLLKEGR